MSQRVEYIQLEAGDDVAHVRDRLSFIRGKRVLIIWPEKGTALTRKLDLVLIQREARRRAVQLALVTHDTGVIAHAQELGISAFETIGAADKGRWKRGRAKVFTQRHHKPEETPTPQELQSVASRVRVPRPRTSALRFIIERVAILLLLLGVLATCAYVVVPSAEITLVLATQQLNAEAQITADPNITDIDIEAALVPMTRLRATVQTSGTVTATGITRGTETIAIGIATFTNETNSAVIIPANTTVSTSAGTPILFKTIAETTLPAGIGERVEIGIEAIQTSVGSVGNVGAGLINTVVGPLESVVSVRNLNPTAGGESRTFASVTAEDRDSLMARLRGQLQSSAYSEMQAQLTDTQIIIIETIRIVEERDDWKTFSHNVGDITDTLSLTMRAVVEANIVDDRFGRQIVFAQLSSQKPARYLLDAESYQYTRGAVLETLPDGRVVLMASGTVTARAQADLSQLQERLSGKTFAEATALIRQSVPLISDPIYAVQPDGLGMLPLLPIRITITASTP